MKEEIKNYIVERIKHEIEMGERDFRAGRHEKYMQWKPRLIRIRDQIIYFIDNLKDSPVET